MRPWNHLLVLLDPVLAWGPRLSGGSTGGVPGFSSWSRVLPGGCPALPWRFCSACCSACLRLPPRPWRIRPAGRWRLNALGGQPSLDHQRPLRLKDGQGGDWQLANRSQELVPEGAAPLPPASTVPGTVAELTLGAQVVEALRELALQQLAELPAKGT